MDKKSVQPLIELLDSVRDLDGFPIAKDEDILALSDPPFYTACPNPYINDFIIKYGTPFDAENDDYDLKPFVADISEGKNDEIYRTHIYHTKIPYKAIMHFIKHYTKEGDIVFDGFCGSGMTGVAGGLLKRKVILSDLSPAASFIAYNFTHPKDPVEYEKKAIKIINEIKQECGWMFKTYHNDQAVSVKSGEKANLLSNNPIECEINYTLWSDVFICPYCNNEYDFWNNAISRDNWKVKEKFECPSCMSEITKKGSKIATEPIYDSIIGHDIEVRKQIPVMIVYSMGGQRYRKNPDENDKKIIEKINKLEIPYWFPNYPMMNKGERWGDTWRKGYHFGITHVNHFYTKRNLWVLSAFANKIGLTKNFVNVTSVAAVINKRYRFTSQKGILGAGGGPLSGTLYVPSLIKEIPLLKVLKEHVHKTVKLKEFLSEIDVPIIQTTSTTDLQNIKDNSVDYIFTDPPFGDNLMYSELNFIWDSWLKVFTANKSEAIINKSQNKELTDYTALMTKCFKEMFRILKPKRWITIVFHNSRASVWNAIQESIVRSGFMITEVTTLDKKQGSFKQVTSTGAVKNDLIINAYKPEEAFSIKFIRNAGENMEIEFINQQLQHLPVRPNVGRTEFMLYSKNRAYYVQNGFKVKYNSLNFYKLLSENFILLDGYWFLEDQVKEYNQWKSGLSLDQLKDVLDGQQVLLVSDEKSALTWIYNFLAEPKEFGDIYTAYQLVATTTDDEIPELREILDNNFIVDKGKYRRPLNHEERQEINKNREKELERTFIKLLEQAKNQKGKIKEVRREALVHGFTKCYQEGKYQDILTIADKLYASTLESSGDIMDFVDIAKIKTSGLEKL